MATYTMLVLEDDPEMRELLVESLEDAGYCTQGAESADEALQLARKFSFDLVVADVRMAGSTDGLGALEALKRRLPELKCIVITGFTNEEAPMRAVKLMVDDYLFKPFKLPDLLATIKRVLGSGQDRAGYRGLLNSLLAGPRKLLEKAEAARREAALKALDQERERCLQGLFVGIRSKHLSRGAALDAWDRIEALDIRREGLDSAPAGTYPELLAGYKQVFELLCAMARSQSVGSHKSRESWQVERVVFSRLFDRVLEGTVAPEQLLVASSIRRTANRANPELVKLHRLLWE